MQTKTGLGLTGNQLKLLALVAMTLDHIGAYLLPQILWLRIVGRLAMPIFAYMIAEGCRYTRSKPKYLGLLALVALVCQSAYFLFMGSLVQCIFVTFSLSVLLIFVLEDALRAGKFWPWVLTVACFLLAWFVCQVLPRILQHTDFRVDYNFCGVLLPVLIYIGRSKWEKLLLGAVGLVLVALDQAWVQWFALAALPLLALYNGQRGKWRLKYLFYLYYPLHLAALYGVKLLIRFWR